MDQVLEHRKTIISEIIEANYLSVLTKKLSQQQQFIDAANEALDNYYRQINKEEEISLGKFIQETVSFKTAINKIITAGNGEQKTENFDQEFAPFITAINQYIESLPSSETKNQSQERFQPGNEDSWPIKAAKALKKIGFSLGNWPKKAGNQIRKFRKKPIVPSKPWKHKIPLQQLSFFYLRDELSLGLLPLFQLVAQKISNAWADLWKLDEAIDRWANQMIRSQFNLSSFDFESYQEKLVEIVNSLEQLKDSLPLQKEEVLQNIYLRYSSAYEKVGTIELPGHRFSEVKIKKKHQLLNSQYQRMNQGWSNTYFVLFEGWNLDRELYSLSYLSSLKYYSAKQSLKQKLTKKILPGISTLKEFLEELKEQLTTFSGDKRALKTMLKQKKNAVQKEFSNILIPKCLDVLFSQNLAKDIDQLEKIIKVQTHQLSTKRAIVRTATFDRIIKANEIDYISPQDLIAFEALPDFIYVTTHVKSELVKGLQSIQLNIRDLAQISDFNLGAALSALGGQDHPQEEAQKIAEEGIGRAIAKVDEVVSALDKLLSALLQQIESSIIAFNDKVSELTETENIFNLKIRVAKARALERSKDLKKKIVENIRNFVPLLFNQAKESSHKVLEYYHWVRKKYGIVSGPEVLSIEVSDFLARAQAAVQKLPYVYQKLFEIIPLEEETFFEKRPVEMENLNKAFQSWQQGNYSTVLLIGETGAGATTILNIFLKESGSKIEVVRLNSTSRIQNPKTLVDFLCRLFKNEELKDLDDLIQFLNNGEDKRIIVLEHLQRFFLRKIDGFLCLNMLFELIFKTRQQVFWLVTINQYSFTYLNKTQALSDHFAYNVNLAELTVDQIISIILKRHGVSGYNLEFLPAKEDLDSKKFQRFGVSEKQDYLKSAYFSKLNKLAGSNIGLTLVYWLRSTAEVIEDTININSIKELDFSFLSSLSGRKIFTIHSILLHGGLSLQEHMMVFNQALPDSELMLLVLHEDGILIMEGEIYKVNPLLYRPIVNLLKSKNLIH